jgi:uncharacterized protein (TIGR02217 family)
VRWRADAASAVRTLADFAAIEKFFYAVGGRLHGFRVRDYGDYTNDSAGGSPILIPLDTDGYAIGTAGYGYGVATYQIAKRYTSGALSHDRWIGKPVSGSVSLTRAGSPVTLGVSAGNAAVASTTGVVTFVADQSQAISTHTPGAAHVITLGTAFSPNAAVGDRVWVTGCGGADAALINDQSHAITNVATTAITISLATTGKTITGGTAKLYPQPDETLAWAGQFDVPVRFDTDQLDRQMIAKTGNEYVAQAMSIPLVEVR